MRTIKQMVDEVKFRERDELRQAVINKGKQTKDGWEYEFDDENRPIVAAYSYDVPADVIIYSVSVEKHDGVLTIIGYNNDDTGYVHHIKPEDVFVGQMEFITNNIG